MKNQKPKPLKKPAGSRKKPKFNPEGAVKVYREIIAKRDAATTAGWRKHYEGFAQTLRHKWKEWQGEDSLHEMAFGEPDE